MWSEMLSCGGVKQCSEHCAVVSVYCVFGINPDNKVHGANMEPIWGRQDPGGPHVGPMNFAL